MDNRIYNEIMNENNKIHAYSYNKNVKNYDFHLHDINEILFFINAKGRYLINKNMYQIKSGQLVIANTQEVHSIILDRDLPYDRIDIAISPYFISQSSSCTSDLGRCFHSKNKKHVITLNPIQISEFTELYKRLEKINKSLHEKGSDILKYSILLEILVFVNNVFMNYEMDIPLSELPKNINDIINYINDNLSEDLSLEKIGKTFYIDRKYLPTVFKKHTGTTVHQYILYARIAYAKKLLKKGFNVTETQQKCGFNDYTNFIKAFKKITGISPGKYKLNF